MEKKNGVLEKKLSGLETLKNLLEEEKNCLINSDMEGLRRLSREKEKVLKRLYGLEMESQKAGIDDVPGELGSKLDTLKLEIRLRAEENQRFVNEMLEFIGGLIDVITGKDHSPSFYGKGVKDADSGPLIYRTQV
ncbi:MAG TPA: flagellar protein FlgN [Desulfobacterales bacterium]|nr:flagellar protein FlgN [Desulfobacterales bacterium]